MDCNPPDFSVHGIFQAGILERLAISFSRRSSQPRDWTLVSCIGTWLLYHWTTREAHLYTRREEKSSLALELTAAGWPCDWVCSLVSVPPSHSGCSAGLRKKLLSGFLSFGLFKAEVHDARSQPGSNTMSAKFLKSEQTSIRRPSSWASEHLWVRIPHGRRHSHRCYHSPLPSSTFSDIYQLKSSLMMYLQEAEKCPIPLRCLIHHWECFLFFSTPAATGIVGETVNGVAWPWQWAPGLPGHLTGSSLWRLRCGTGASTAAAPARTCLCPGPRLPSPLCPAAPTTWELQCLGSNHRREDQIRYRHERNGSIWVQRRGDQWNIFLKTQVLSIQLWGHVAEIPFQRSMAFTWAM